jgi:hypothetical protein
MKRKNHVSLLVPRRLVEALLTRDAVEGEKHRSGLSDMLAAFPPPAHPPTAPSRRSFRDSVREQVQSWPLPLNFNRTPDTSQEATANTSSQPSEPKRGRRCCGLPLWGFIIVMVVVIILIAAAVVIPLEFFVIRKQNSAGQAQAALQQCQSQLTCANGGTNVVNQGFCSCICTNGFTGPDCTVANTIGCTTISLTGDSSNINGVTLGDAIPRLIQQAQANFSIPLSGTGILAKLNAGNLSCLAENALVTFDGQATRQGDAHAQVVSPSSDTLNAANIIDGIAYTTITIMAGEFTTITLKAATLGPVVPTPTLASPTTSVAGFSTILTVSGTFSTVFATTITFSRSASASRSPTTTSTVTTTMTSSVPSATAAFAVTEETLDFARVAVLYILQEESLSNAETAQVSLQKFFNSASSGATNGGVNTQAARNVTVGNGNSVDLVDFSVDTGASGGAVGRKTVSLKARDWPGAILSNQTPHLVEDR